MKILIYSCSALYILIFLLFFRKIRWSELSIYAAALFILINKIVCMVGYLFLLIRQWILCNLIMQDLPSGVHTCVHIKSF